MMNSRNLSKLEKSIDFDRQNSKEASLDRSYISKKSAFNESIFLKSHEFPRYLKRKTKKPYTKMLVPVSSNSYSS